MGFSPINRWPSKNHHLRNVEIALEVSTGKTYREVAKLYALSCARVQQVYRILAAKLCERKFKIEYMIAVCDKQWTRHVDMPKMIRQYHANYISWITKNNGGE
jgi:hypothetical protein